jgi:D-sedoheptulose 7-phosphate isomerase
MTTSGLHSEWTEHQQILEKTIKTQGEDIQKIIDGILQCFRRGNKLLLCGNGGSAADAQHIAGEFVNRYQYDRPALPALALTTDTSVLTCIANDSAFDNIFSRQVEALGSKGDILVGISTSGGSPNVLKAIQAAHSKGMLTIAFTGEKGRETLASKCDLSLVIPSKITPRIQEGHLFCWHYICGVVENELFPANKK